MSFSRKWLVGLGWLLLVGVVVLGVFFSGKRLSELSTATSRIEPEENSVEMNKIQPARVGEIHTDGVGPVGLQLSPNQAVFFPTPRAKLATEPLAFQAAVSSGVSSFLITVKELSWEESCQKVSEITADEVFPDQELVDLSGQLPQPDWEVCWLGEPSQQRVVVVVKKTFPDLLNSGHESILQFAAPLHEIGAVEEVRRVVEGSTFQR